jgi:hypothetical protein
MAYQSRVGARFSLVWERLPLEERRLVAELAGLPVGAVRVPASHFNAEDRSRLLLGMRRVLALALECQFALGYWRSPPKRRTHARALEES